MSVPQSKPLGNHFWNEQRVKNFMHSMELVPTNWDENIAAMAKSGGISVEEFLEMNPVTFGERVFCNTFLVSDIIGRRNYYELLRHRDLTTPENLTTWVDNDAAWAALAARNGSGGGGMLASAAVFATSRAEAAARDADEKVRNARAAQAEAEAALSNAAVIAAEAAIAVEADNAAEEEAEHRYNEKRALKGPSVAIADIERVAAGTDMSLEEALNILRNERNAKEAASNAVKNEYVAQAEAEATMATAEAAMKIAEAAQIAVEVAEGIAHKAVENLQLVECRLEAEAKAAAAAATEAAAAATEAAAAATEAEIAAWDKADAEEDAKADAEWYTEWYDKVAREDAPDAAAAQKKKEQAAFLRKVNPWWPFMRVKNTLKFLNIPNVPKRVSYMEGLELLAKRAHVDVKSLVGMSVSKYNKLVGIPKNTLVVAHEGVTQGKGWQCSFRL